MQRNLAWYDHFPEAVMTVMENYQVKLQWDFRIQTDHHLDHNRPDIVVLEKKWRRCFIVDVPCPYFDTRVAEKEKEKIQHVSGLKSGRAIWNCRSVIAVIPIVIGALGTVSKHLRMWISKLGTPGIIALLQIACLLGTAKILIIIIIIMIIIIIIIIVLVDAAAGYRLSAAHPTLLFFTLGIQTFVLP